MCLDKLVDFKPGRVGYKVMRYLDGWCTSIVLCSLPVDKWVKDNHEEPINKNGFPEYQPGFHVWRTLGGAKSWKCAGESIHKVHYRNVVATGTQGAYCNHARQFKVVVAREIYVESKEVV